VEKTKPEPDLVKAALEKAEGAEAVMVGDTKWDVDAAAKVDVPTVCVMTGGWSRQELLDAGAVEVYESVEELRRQLDETPLAG
jgi:phosphoglycolate phosphatase-like HAD superfamily hydrolase